MSYISDWNDRREMDDLRARVAALEAGSGGTVPDHDLDRRPVWKMPVGDWTEVRPRDGRAPDAWVSAPVPRGETADGLDARAAVLTSRANDMRRRLPADGMPVTVVERFDVGQLGDMDPEDFSVRLATPEAFRVQHPCIAAEPLEANRPVWMDHNGHLWSTPSCGHHRDGAHACADAPGGNDD